MARVVEILVAPSPTVRPVSVKCVRAIPGCGLEGDRYAKGNGTFSHRPQVPSGELTLIEKEHIERFVATTGRAFSAADSRRNLVTQGVDLNALVGRKFWVGHVLIRGIRLCEPCNHLAKQMSPEILQYLLHKAGLRAQILTPGEIRVGDSVSEVIADEENR